MHFTQSKFASILVFIGAGVADEMECQDVPAWSNGYIDCAKHGFSKAQGCTPSGFNCAAYAYMFCNNGSVKPAFGLLVGPIFNDPEKNCCACGGGLRQSRTQAAEDLALRPVGAIADYECQDYIGWYSGARSCKMQTKRQGGVCAFKSLPDGRTPKAEEWHLGTGWVSGDACVEATCTVTEGVPWCTRKNSGFSNRLPGNADWGFCRPCEPEKHCIANKGWTCSAYAGKWCENGAVKAGAKLAVGKANNWPERHCCVCGGGHRTLKSDDVHFCRWVPLWSIGKAVAENCRNNFETHVEKQESIKMMLPWGSDTGAKGSDAKPWPRNEFGWPLPADIVKPRSDIRKRVAESRWPKNVPIIIVNRDLLVYLQKLVNQLRAMGYDNVIILDNDSTYAPLLSYYSEGPAWVVKLRANFGSVAPWQSGLVYSFPGRWFYLDSDMAFTQESPHDWLLHYWRLLDRHPQFIKVGPVRKYDDIPSWYPLRNEIRWMCCGSKDWVEGELNVSRSSLKTAPALYREGSQWIREGKWFTSEAGNALMVHEPYSMRHMPWYEDPRLLKDDVLYSQLHRGRGHHHGLFSQFLDEKLAARRIRRPILQTFFRAMRCNTTCRSDLTQDQMKWGCRFRST